MIRKLQVQSAQNNERIDIFLGKLFPQITRSASKRIVLEGLVTLNNQKTRPSVKLKEGNELFIDDDGIRNYIQTKIKSEIAPQKIDFEVIFEDENSLVINKPSGIPVHPSYKHIDNTLLNGVLYHVINNSQNPFVKVRPVHRLDKDTSGVILFSKSLEAHKFYSRQFKKHEAEKTYIAFVEGDFGEYLEKNDKEYLIIKNYLSKKAKQIKYSSVSSSEGDYAETEIYFLGFSEEKKISKLTVKPKTGRTHQIRVHLSELGFPIIGDPIYGGKENERLMLHASRLTLKLFQSGKEINFEANFQNQTY